MRRRTRHPENTAEKIGQKSLLIRSMNIWLSLKSTPCKHKANPLHDFIFFFQVKFPLNFAPLQFITYWVHFKRPFSDNNLL